MIDKVVNKADGVHLKTFARRRSGWRREAIEDRVEVRGGVAMNPFQARQSALVSF